MNLNQICGTLETKDIGSNHVPRNPSMVGLEDTKDLQVASTGLPRQSALLKAILDSDSDDE